MTLRCTGIPPNAKPHRQPLPRLRNSAQAIYIDSIIVEICTESQNEIMPPRLVSYPFNKEPHRAASGMIIDLDGKISLEPLKAQST